MMKKQTFTSSRVGVVHRVFTRPFGRSLLIWTLSLLGTVALPQGSATAQAAPPAKSSGANSADSSSVASDAEAAALARAGEEAAAAGDLDTARDKLTQAFARNPAFDIAGNLGGVEFGLGRYREAAEHLSFSLRNYPAGGSDQQRQLTESFLAKAKAKICTVVIDVSPAGAAVVADGRNLGTAPLEGSRFLEPGDHVISASAKDHHGQEQEISCRAGSETEVLITLQRSFTLYRGGDATEDESAGELPVWPIVLGSSIAAAGIGTGIGLAIGHDGVRYGAENWSTSLPSDQNDTPLDCISTPCSHIDALESRQAALFKGMIVGFAVGGAALLGTTLYGISLATAEDGDGEDTGARVVLTPGGMSVVGTF